MQAKILRLYRLIQHNLLLFLLRRFFKNRRLLPVLFILGIFQRIAFRIRPFPVYPNCTDADRFSKIRHQPVIVVFPIVLRRPAQGFVRMISVPRIHRPKVLAFLAVRCQLRFFCKIRFSPTVSTVNPASHSSALHTCHNGCSFSEISVML